MTLRLVAAVAALFVPLLAARCSLSPAAPSVQVRISPRPGKRDLTPFKCFFVMDDHPTAVQTLASVDLRGRSASCMELDKELSSTFSQAVGTSATGVPLPISAGNHTLTVYGAKTAADCSGLTQAEFWERGDPQIFEIGSYSGPISPGDTITVVVGYEDNPTLYPDKVAACEATSYLLEPAYAFQGRCGFSGGAINWGPTPGTIPPFTDCELASMSSVGVSFPISVSVPVTNSGLHASLDFLFRVPDPALAYYVIRSTFSVKGNGGNGDGNPTPCFSEALVAGDFEVGQFSKYPTDRWLHDQTGGAFERLNVISGPPSYYFRTISSLSGQYIHTTVRSSGRATISGCLSFNVSQARLKIERLAR